MTALRSPLCLVIVATAAAAPLSVHGQAAEPAAAAHTLKGGWFGNTRTSLGLTIGRARSALPCGSTSLLCDNSDRIAHVYADTMIGKFWGVEVGYLDTGRMPGVSRDSRAQGLNLALVGKAPLAHSLGVFGKVGTTYARTETSVMGGSAAPGSEQGFGLSYGAGMSFAFTPRLSGTLQWDSNDFRFAGGVREPVRSTSLGLQYRY